MGLKKNKPRFLKQLIVVHEKQLPGFLADAILQCLDDSMTKSSI